MSLFLRFCSFLLVTQEKIGVSMVVTEEFQAQKWVKMGQLLCFHQWIPFLCYIYSIRIIFRIYIQMYFRRLCPAQNKPKPGQNWAYFNFHNCTLITPYFQVINACWWWFFAFTFVYLWFWHPRYTRFTHLAPHLPTSKFQFVLFNLSTFIFFVHA